jgi:serine/threonine protein kinase
MEQGDAPRFTFALKRGTILAGRYRIDRLLADSSSFALTYLATDTSIAGSAPVRVAIKEFLPRVLVGRAANGSSVQAHSPADAREFGRSLQRFLREGEVLGGIDSPHLTRVHRCLLENGTGYSVMEPRPGRALPAALSEVPGGCIPAGEAVALVASLLGVLEKMHAQGVFHRAISVNAVAVTDGWHPVLHGFSSRRHVCGEPPELVPGYAAFEQYASGDLGPWTDVYGCAALLYQLVAGVAPPAAVYRAVGKPLAPAGWLTRDVSSALSSAIARGLALMPEQRPLSAGEFRTDLERAMTIGDTPSISASPFKSVKAVLDTLPTIDADFGPGTPIAAQVVAKAPPLAASENSGNRLLATLTDRMRDGLRSASAILRMLKRRTIDVRIGEASPDSMKKSAAGLLASIRHGEHQRTARYVGAAVLTLAVVGTAYGVLSRDDAGENRRASTGPQMQVANSDVQPTAPAQPPIGALQQGVVLVPETSAPKPAPRNVDQQKTESTRESAPAGASLPTVKRVNVGAPIDAEQDLVPVEVVLDLRTRLSNGRQQADAGEYALARRILASAMTSAGSAINKYSGSRTLQSIRAELDSADRRVLSACQAENEVLKKRGGSAVPCE